MNALWGNISLTHDWHTNCDLKRNNFKSGKMSLNLTMEYIFFYSLFQHLVWQFGTYGILLQFIPWQIGATNHTSQQLQSLVYIY